MANFQNQIHAGEALVEDFLKPMGISARQLAAEIDVSPSRISELVKDKSPTTANTARCLGPFFGMEPRFWLALQTEYDMRVAVRQHQARIAPRIRVHVAGARPRTGALKLSPTR